MPKSEAQTSSLPDFKDGERVRVWWTIGDGPYEFVGPVVYVGQDPMNYYVGVNTNRGLQSISILKGEKTENVEDWTALSWSISHDGIRHNVKIERME